MPPGKVHFAAWKRVWRLIIPVFGLSVWLTGGDVLLSSMILVGYLLGAVIEPDLDQLSITLSEGNMMRSFGCFGVAWVSYWFPYASLLPHRSFLSHFPFVSTFLRLLYLSLPVIGVQIYSYWIGVPVPWDLYKAAFPYAVMLWFGLSCSDLLHYLLDKTF